MQFGFDMLFVLRYSLLNTIKLKIRTKNSDHKSIQSFS